MVISYQVLFIIISTVIYFFLKDKTFKYYALFNITLIIYIVSRYNAVYDGFVNFASFYLGYQNAVNFTKILNFFVQVNFYSFYVIFVMYFLDFHRNAKKFFNSIVLLLRILIAFFFIAAFICFYFNVPDLYIGLFSFIFLPSIIALFIPSVSRVIKFSGIHKYYLIVGVFIFIVCGLIAFAGSYIPSLNIENPISFFYLGLIIETIFFSLGLAYKIKMINDERAKIRLSVTHHKHKQHISKIHGLIEGEEKEKRRIAEELHDGITGDLSAIKMNLERLQKDDYNLKNIEIIDDVNRIVEKSRLHIREISHNLSPHSIVNYGLITAVKSYSKNIESLYNIDCLFTFVGDHLDITVEAETHLYRIVQELFNNIIKHSKAKSASVFISYYKPEFVLKITDSGNGFSFEGLKRGIGFDNIESRIRILNGKFTKDQTEVGCAFTIRINTDKIPLIKKQGVIG